MVLLGPWSRVFPSSTRGAPAAACQQPAALHTGPRAALSVVRTPTFSWRWWSDPSSPGTAASPFHRRMAVCPSPATVPAPHGSPRGGCLHVFADVEGPRVFRTQARV